MENERSRLAALFPAPPKWMDDDALFNTVLESLAQKGELNKYECPGQERAWDMSAGGWMRIVEHVMAKLGLNDDEALNLIMATGWREHKFMGFLASLETAQVGGAHLA